MSKALAIKTNDYISTALKTAQDTHSPAAWCHRNPKHWEMAVQHIIQQPGTVSDFLLKHSIKRNFYYDTKAELMKDPECEAIRNAWGAEVASVMFQGLDTHRLLQEKFSREVEKDDFVVDQDVLFKHGKQLQAFNDIHGKLTGNNIQKIVVEHKTTLDEAKAFRDAALAGITEDEVVDV